MIPNEDIFDRSPNPRSVFKGVRILLVALVLALPFNLFIYRPVVKWIVTPSETRAAWVESLASFGTGLNSIREIPPLDVTRLTFLEIIRAANDQKRRLISTYSSGKGHYGLMSRYSTVEGAWIYTWLLAENGKLRYVDDHTREGGAPASAVNTSIPTRVRLGFMRSGKFVEGEPAADDSPILVIELDIGRYDPARFY